MDNILVEEVEPAAPPHLNLFSAWMNILFVMFPMTEGFAPTSQSHIGRGQEDFSINGVSRLLEHWHEPYFQENKFVVVAHKATEPETRPQDPVWTNLAGKLESYLDYLDATAATSGEPRFRRLGMVANGKAVRFYEWVDGALVDFNGDGKIRYVDRECQDITTILKEIRSIKD